MKCIKHFPHQVAVLFLTGVLSSCSLWVGEKASSSFGINGFSRGCLNEIGEKADRYIQGRLTEEEIDQVSNCMKTALTLFKERVHGKTRGEFTPDELRKFIQNLFLQDRPIPDALFIQLVRLKQVIIGGSADKLTEKDIDRFIIFTDVVKKEVLFFQPYIKALNLLIEKKKINGTDYLTGIDKDLKRSIARISVFMRSFSNSYSFTDMNALIKEVVNFLFENRNLPPLIDAKLELIGVLKQFTVGGSDLVIQPEEWEDFLLAISHLVSANVHYVVLKKQDPFISPKGMHYTFLTLKDLLNFLTISVKNRKEGVIQKEEFLKLAFQSQKAGFLTNQLTEKAVYNMLLIVFGKVFNVDKDRYGTIELTQAQLSKIQKTLAPWIGRQSFLDHIALTGDFQKNLTDVEQMRPFFSSEENFLNGKKGIDQMLLLKPLYKEGKKITLSRESYFGEKSSVKLDFKNLTIYNFYYLIAVMMKAGYATDITEVLKETAVDHKDHNDNKAVDRGITQEELRNFFLDFQIIGQNMGWLEGEGEGRILSAGEAEFMAANILTPTAKGFDHDWSKEEYLTSNEIVEYLAYAFSFGFSLKEMENFFTFCRAPSSSDSDVELYDIDCVRVQLPAFFRNRMQNMPDLLKVLSKMNKQEEEALSTSLLYIAFESGDAYETAEYITRNHLKNIVMAIYFVETTINRYDLNGDLILQNEEIWTAFSSFKGYLSRVLIYLFCQESDKLVSAMYGYVVHKKKLPASQTLKWYERQWAWGELQLHRVLKNGNIDYWDLNLNRKQLTTVFSTIVKGFLEKRRQANQQVNICPANHPAIPPKEDEPIIALYGGS